MGLVVTAAWPASDSHHAFVEDRGTCAIPRGRPALSLVNPAVGGSGAVPVRSAAIARRERRSSGEEEP